MSDTIEYEGFPVYGRTPRLLLRDPNISAQAKTLWTLLEDHASPEAPEPFPGQDTLAAYLGVTDRTVRSWIAELEEQGWLIVKPSRRGNSYVLVWRRQPRPEAHFRPDRKHTSAQTGSTLPPKKNHEEEPVEEKTTPAPSQAKGSSQPELFGPADRGATRRTEKLRKTKGSDISPFVEPLWKRYPTKLNKDGKPDPKSKGSKPAAERAVRKALKAGHTSGELLTRVDHYNDARDAYEASWGKPAPLMNASTFFNGKHEMFDHPWDSDELQYWPAPKGRDWARPKRRPLEDIIAEENAAIARGEKVDI